MIGPGGPSENPRDILRVVPDQIAQRVNNYAAIDIFNARITMPLPTLING
jgi:hypothetical protein